MATEITEYKAQLGKRIRDAREKRGLGLRELARMSEISPSYLTEIEQGISVPTVEKVQRLAAALGTTLSRLLPAA